MKNNKLIPSLVFFLFVISTSPVFDYIGVRSSVTFIGLSCLILSIMYINNQILKLKYFILSIFTFLLFTFYALYWSDLKLVIFPVYIILSILVIMNLKKQQIEKVIKYIYIYLFVAVVFSCISFVYNFLGGDALFSITNPDGRINGFYLLSFSNSNNGIFIRPSGFFDEPGALSFHVCMILALRIATGKNNKGDCWLLIFSFVTLSLAGFIFSIFYIIAITDNFKKVIKFFLFLSVVSFSVFLIIKDTPIYGYIQNRLTINDDGQLRGDNRTALLKNAYYHLDENVIFRGLDSTCTTDYSKCLSKYGGMGENPLSLLTFLGLWSVPYYIFLCFCFFSRVKWRVILIAVGLLFMQRPYFYNLGYSLWVIFIFVCFFKVRVKRDFNNNSYI